MHHLGAPIVYTVSPGQLAKTRVFGGDEVLGSHFHPELIQFAGQIARVHADGETADLVIFPPDRPPRHVQKVTEGEGPGQFVPYELWIPVIPVAETDPLVGSDGAERPDTPPLNAPASPDAPAEGDEAADRQLQAMIE